jgi:hypothetical protein
MLTSSPFRCLEPKFYIRQRYSPLYVTYVEEDVEKLFKLCGLTFTDFFAAIASRETEPVRIIPHQSVVQEFQDVFFGNLTTDVTLCAQSFVFGEFEESGTTVPQLSPIPSRFPSSLQYPTPESMNPIWYQLMAERLLGSLQFTDFDFCDLPVCVIYATLTGCDAKRADEIRAALDFPAWMREFLLDIPIVCVVVYDGLLVSKPPPDCTAPRGAFDCLLGLCFRTRRMGTAGGISAQKLEQLFRFDGDLRAAESFCAFLSDADIAAAKVLLKGLRVVAGTGPTRLRAESVSRSRTRSSSRRGSKASSARRDQSE